MAWKVFGELERLIHDLESVEVDSITPKTIARQKTPTWMVHAFGDEKAAPRIMDLMNRQLLEAHFDALYDRTGDEAFASHRRPRIQFTSFRQAPRSDSAGPGKGLAQEIQFSFRLDQRPEQ